MDREPTFIDYVRNIVVIIIPLGCLFSAALLDYETLAHSAKYQAQLSSERFGTITTNRWIAIQKKRYKAIRKNIPDGQQNTNPGYRGAGFTGQTIGNVFASIANHFAVWTNKIVYSSMWIIWPRLTRWSYWLPVIGLFIIGCIIDARYRRKELQHHFFLPKQWRATSAAWLSAIGIILMTASLFWALPVYTIIPSTGLIALGVGIILWRSIPLVAGY